MYLISFSGFWPVCFRRFYFVSYYWLPRDEPSPATVTEALGLLESHEFDEAITLMETLRTGGESVAPYVCLLVAQAAVENCRFDTAETWLREGLTGRDEDVERMLMLSALLRVEGRNDELRSLTTLMLDRGVACKANLIALTTQDLSVGLGNSMEKAYEQAIMQQATECNSQFRNYRLHCFIVAKDKLTKPSSCFAPSLRWSRPMQLLNRILGSCYASERMNRSLSNGISSCRQDAR
ncbi:MAG: hypothetical protein R3C05_22200 [Pirellulaceae bacterium]